MEFVDEASATVAKDALHNYKLDGENKIKVRIQLIFFPVFLFIAAAQITFARK